MTVLHTVDIQIILSKDLGAIVDRVAGTVENSTQHVLSNRELHAAASELDVRGLDIDAGCSLEDLHDGLLSLDFEDLSSTRCAIRKCQLDNFIVRRKLYSSSMAFPDKSTANTAYLDVV